MQTIRDSDALAILLAGIQSVHGDQVVRQNVAIHDKSLSVGGLEFDLRKLDRLLVVGAGKATESMTLGLMDVLRAAGVKLPISGWVNIPVYESSLVGTRLVADCPIEIFAARPAGKNEPTTHAQLGTTKILQLASHADSRTGIVTLLSGGGSALLVAPPPGITLEDKIKVTRMLSQRGASIVELNTVRRALSLIKAGGLARQGSHAAWILSMILSDVLGDPIESIASGPTWIESQPDPQAALQLLIRFDPNWSDVPKNVVQYLETQASTTRSSQTAAKNKTLAMRVEHVVLANNASAVDAAGVRAVEFGYDYFLQSAKAPEPEVKVVAQRFIELVQAATDNNRGPNCFIDGGEPSVQVANSQSGQGGRNQHLVLLVLCKLLQSNQIDRMKKATFLSAGTDGEDGATSAAGAILNWQVITEMQRLNLDPYDFATRFDSHNFFRLCGGLVETGPTGTNVCDLRILLVDRKS